MRRGFAVPKLRRCNSKTHPRRQACSSCASFLLTSCENDAKISLTERYRRGLGLLFLRRWGRRRDIGRGKRKRCELDVVLDLVGCVRYCVRNWGSNPVNSPFPIMPQSRLCAEFSSEVCVRACKPEMFFFVGIGVAL